MKMSLMTALCAAAFALPAMAQEMTAQQKFDALKEKGIFNGVTDGEGGLDREMTRAQFAKVAALLAGLDTDAAPVEKTFKDVGTTGWYTGYIDAAVDAGLMNGGGSGTFNPDASLTIEQLAVVMAKALGLEPVDDAQVDGASDWAKGYIAAALNAGLIPSSDDYTSGATREQLVTAAYQPFTTQTNDQGVQDAVTDAGSGGSNWSEFPFYAAGDISPDAPSPYGAMWATYEGRMDGAFSNGDPVGASLNLEFDLQATAFYGSMTFSDGSAGVSGGWSAVNDINGTFNGGTLAGDDINGTLSGAFYGPNNEEIGGTWDMNVTGRGDASGKFAAKK